MKVLIKAQADVDAKTFNLRETPLHIAATDGSTDAAIELCAANAAKNAMTKQGLTPLHYAARDNYFDLVRVLCDADANIEAQDKVRQRGRCTQVKCTVQVPREERTFTYAVEKDPTKF